MRLRFEHKFQITMAHRVIWWDVMPPIQEEEEKLWPHQSLENTWCSADNELSVFANSTFTAHHIMLGRLLSYLREQKKQEKAEHRRGSLHKPAACEAAFLHSRLRVTQISRSFRICLAGVAVEDVGLKMSLPKGSALLFSDVRQLCCPLFDTRNEISSAPLNADVI